MIIVKFIFYWSKGNSYILINKIKLIILFNKFTI